MIFVTRHELPSFKKPFASDWIMDMNLALSTIYQYEGIKHQLFFII